MKPDKIDRMHILEETHWHEYFGTKLKAYGVE